MEPATFSFIALLTIFVLAIFIIHDDNHLAGLDVVDDFLCRVETHVEINWLVHLE